MNTLRSSTRTLRKNPGRGSHNMSVVARRAMLMDHPWVVPGSVTPHSVVCAACGNEIKMDSRGEYYVGFWTKHTKRCRSILIGELQRRRGYTVGEAHDYLDTQKKARLQASRQARERARADAQAHESDWETITDSESSNSDASLPQSPVSTSATRPVARKEFHLNPVVETNTAVAPSDSPAPATLAYQLHEDLNAIHLNDRV